MTDVYTTELVALGTNLAQMAVKGTVTAVSAKIRAIKDEKNAEKIRNTYDEIVNELLSEREEAIRIAQAYKSELEKVVISDEDIQHLHNTVANVLKIMTDIQIAGAERAGEAAVKAVKEQTKVYEQFMELISVDTLKTMQLIGSKFIFDITTSDMRSQIINSLKERISEQENIAKELDLEIREKQTRFNKITDSRNITLEDIFVYREDYISLEDIDKELTLIADELSNVDRIIKTDKQISAKNKVDRKNLKDKIVAKMNKIHRKLGNNDGSPDYSDLFTTEGKPYSGSEATEFLMARMYALVDCLHHQLPILVDSFRAEELSTGREEKMLPLFKDLENQVILTATLKEQEIGKYWGIEWINNIDLSGYTPNKLLSSKYCAEFANEIERFGVKLMQL